MCRKKCANKFHSQIGTPNVISVVLLPPQIVFISRDYQGQSVSWSLIVSDFYCIGVRKDLIGKPSKPFFGKSWDFFDFNGNFNGKMTKIKKWPKITFRGPIWVPKVSKVPESKF